MRPVRRGAPPDQEQPGAHAAEPGEDSAWQALTESREQPRLTAGAVRFPGSDSTDVAESSLSKVVRLAGGTTSAYTRTVNGRPVRVGQYATPHPAAAQAAVQQPLAAPVKPAARQPHVPFGSLRQGQVIRIHGQNYKVMQVNVPAGAGFSTGSGVSTGSGTSTGSRGTGVNTAATAAGAAAAATAQSNASAAAAAATAAKMFGTPQQNPAKAALNNQPLPKGSATVTDLLSDTVSGYTWYTTLPASYMVQVVG